MERTTRQTGHIRSWASNDWHRPPGCNLDRVLAGIGALLIVGGLAVPAVGLAQTPEPSVATPDPRGNIRLEVGIGLASAGFGGDAGARGVEREAGAFAHLGAGFAIGRHLHLGAEGALWAKETAGRTTTIRSMLAVAWVRPAADGRLWLKGGIGVIELDEPDIGNRGAGGAALLGAGYDFALGARTALAPWLQFTFSRDVEVIQYGNRTGFTENPNLVHFGLSFAWQ